MDSSILEVGAKLATPLSLAGFALAVLYLLYRVLLRGQLLSRLGATHSFRIINRVITFVFILAIVAMLLGLGGYFAGRLQGVIKISSPELSGDMYFTNITVIEKEYRQTQGRPLNQELKQKIERAINLAKAGNYKNAIPVFEEVVQKVPLASVYNNLGVLSAATQNYEKARQAYNQAIEKNPEHQAAHLNLGLLDERQGRIDEAKRPIKETKKLESSIGLSQPATFQGVVAEMTRFDTTGGLLTLEVTYRNLGIDTVKFWVNPWDSYLIDEKTGQRWNRIHAGGGMPSYESKLLKPSDDHLIWIKFLVGEPFPTRFTAVVDKVQRPFERLTIR
jgi:tetratricopeptide (TPR) repeat protein